MCVVFIFNLNDVIVLYIVVYVSKLCTTSGSLLCNRLCYIVLTFDIIISYINSNIYVLFAVASVMFLFAYQEYQPCNHGSY